MYAIYVIGYISLREGGVTDCGGVWQVGNGEGLDKEG